MNAKEGDFIKIISITEEGVVTFQDISGVYFSLYNEQYADHKTQELQQEVERLKKKVKNRNHELCELNVKHDSCKQLNQQLKQEKEELKEWMKRLKEEVFNGSSNISGRLQREGEQLLTKTNKDDKSK